MYWIKHSLWDCTSYEICELLLRKKADLSDRNRQGAHCFSTT